MIDSSIEFPEISNTSFAMIAIRLFFHGPNQQFPKCANVFAWDQRFLNINQTKLPKNVFAVVFSATFEHTLCHKLQLDEPATILR